MLDLIPDRKMKIGIIGTGGISDVHLEQYLKMPDVEIVAAADLIPGKAEALMDSYVVKNVRFYPSHKEMIDSEELDGVSICTYNASHAECAIYALEHGVNVLLEKPFTVTLDEAVAVCRAEKKSGKILTVGFQPRMDNNMKQLKKICQSGELGKIYYIQTGGGRRRYIPNRTFIEKKTAGIGAIGDIGCYSLDMVLNSIGYPKPLTVTGYTSGFFGSNPKYNNPSDAARFDVDDFAAAFIRLEGDIVLDFRISWAMHIDSPCDTVILGTEGALRIPSTPCWNGAFTGPMKLYKDIAGQQVETELPLLPKISEGLFYPKVRTFLDAIRYGLPSPIPSREMIYNQAIIDGVVKSAQAGHEIAIEIPEI